MLPPLELGKAPIDGDSPFGADAKETIEYELIMDEVAKISSLQGFGSVNWKIVADNAVIILQTKAKDISVASYLAIALAQTDKMQGWLCGGQILKDVLDVWWDNAFPPVKRMKGRVNSIDWWHEYSFKFFSDFQDELEYDFSEEVKEFILSIDEIIGEKLPDASALHDLRQGLTRLRIKPKPVETPQVEESAKAQTQDDASTSQASGQASASTQAPASTAQASGPSLTIDQTQLEDATKAKSQLIAVAKQYFFLCIASEDAQNLLTQQFTWHSFYMAVWGNLKNLPPSENKQTMIPAPLSQRMDALFTLFDGAKFSDLINACTSLAPEVPFCLDLHYLLHGALKGLGEKYAPALQVLEQEIAAFMARMKGVESLSFSDDTPFANEDTKQLFQEMYKKYNELQSAEGTGTALNPIIVQTRVEVAELIASKDFSRALEKMHIASFSLHGADYVTMRLDQVRLLLKQKQTLAAKALGLELEEIIEQYHLEKWDMSLCQEVFKTLRDIWKTQESSDFTKQKLEKILEKLYRINPSLAL